MLYLWNGPGYNEKDGRGLGDASVYLFSMRVGRSRVGGARQDGDCGSCLVGFRQLLIIDGEQLHDFEPESPAGSD